MRIERQRQASERRRHTDAVSPFFEPSRTEQGGRERLQDKGSASGALLSCGLHIPFSGGCASWGGGCRLALAIVIAGGCR